LRFVEFLKAEELESEKTTAEMTRKLMNTVTKSPQAIFALKKRMSQFLVHRQNEYEARSGSDVVDE